MSALSGDGAAAEFWREEYRLDALIARYAKPVVAVMDGIVMGGGIGLAAYASYRIPAGSGSGMPGHPPGTHRSRPHPSAPLATA
jgi:enoyl-CoA hydratase/carnithine racemase